MNNTTKRSVRLAPGEEWGKLPPEKHALLRELLAPGGAIVAPWFTANALREAQRQADTQDTTPEYPMEKAHQ